MVVFQICSLTKIHQTVYEQKGLHEALKAHHMHFGENRTHEHKSRDLFLFHSYSTIAEFSALSFFSLVFLTALFFLCSASYFTDVSVADSG